MPINDGVWYDDSSDKNLSACEVVDYCINCFGMWATLECLIEKVNQVNKGEAYLNKLVEDLRVTLSNYKDRYK